MEIPRPVYSTDAHNDKNSSHEKLTSTLTILYKSNQNNSFVKKTFFKHNLLFFLPQLRKWGNLFLSTRMNIVYKKDFKTKRAIRV